MDDEDDEMGHFYTGLCDTRVLARTMLEDLATEPAVYDNDKGETTLIVIRDGTEIVSRPRTQQEIPTMFRMLNSRARIYRA